MKILGFQAIQPLGLERKAKYQEFYSWLYPQSYIPKNNTTLGNIFVYNGLNYEIKNSRKTIFLCASMAFYKDLVEIEKQLVSKGFTVNIPVSAGIMKRKNDFNVSHFKGVFSPQQKKEFIQENFEKIIAGDSILVINNEKNGAKGYIGANVLMEIGLAFHFKKKIYVWDSIDESAPYKEELLSFGVKFINNNLNKVR